MRHVGAARVHVALPRGLACHVASTWDPRDIKPLFTLFFISFNLFKSKLNRKKSRKIPKNCKNHIFQNTTPN